MSTAAAKQHTKSDVVKSEQHSSQLNGQLATQNQQIAISETQNSFSDLRTQATTQRQLKDAANQSPQSHQLKTFQQIAQSSSRSTQLKIMSAMMNATAVQRVDDEETLQAKMEDSTVQREEMASAAPKLNNTGLPDNLKSGIEALSGMSMNHVKVHYNSSQPAQLKAHAYAQGSEIHLAPGQEQHLPHEAWHVVQQAQGRVKPTMQMKTGVAVNDDVGLEAEADAMGVKAIGLGAVQAQMQQKAYAGTLKQNAISLSSPSRFNLQLRKEAVTLGMDAPTLDRKAAEGAVGHEVDDAHLIHKGYRKINRFLGLLSPIGIMANVKTALEPAIADINASDPANAFAGTLGHKDAVRAASEGVLDNVIAAPDVVSAEHAAYLGPLDYWSNVEVSSDSIATRLKTLRMDMLVRDRMSVVAHRAMGATNRSFGGLISDADPARQRPVENSPGAFNLALAESAKDTKPDGIDGVECDVFLSSDGVAMLSHDDHIAEQMSVAKRAAYVGGATIGSRTSDDLRGLARRHAAPVLGGPAPIGVAPALVDDASSVFMTLSELLTAAAGISAAYVAHTNKPFRVEIEMKGHDVGVHDIIDVTAKTISQFKKTNPQAANIEVVMFNGTPADVDKHANKRASKSRLGNLTVALGGAPPVGVAPAKIDEYRSSLSAPEQVRVADPAVTPTYISTYVLGAEKKLLDDVAPTFLDWSSRQLSANVITFIRNNLLTLTTENATFGANRATLDPEKPALMSAADFKTNVTYALRVERGRHKHAAHLLAQQRLAQADPRYTHVLTDFPERTTDTRARINPPVVP